MKRKSFYDAVLLGELFLILGLSLAVLYNPENHSWVMSLWPAWVVKFCLFR